MAALGRRPARPRGAYYPGFDVVGAANGLFLWSTRSAWDAVATVFANSRQYGSPFPFYSAVSALLPGVLASGLGSSGVASSRSGVFVVTLWLVARATALPRPDSWVVLLAWSASPALLSFSVTSFGWTTAFLPHALALLVVLDPGEIAQQILRNTHGPRPPRRMKTRGDSRLGAR